MSCCRGAHIALDPYEIARLARNRDLSTTEFIARYLTEGGIVLRNREDASCIMLGAGACTVYADRPQICRTYPLKRLRAQGPEVFVQYRQLPTSTGVYVAGGTIGDFLSEQCAEDYFTAKDRYCGIAFRIVSALGAAARREPQRFGRLRDLIDSHCTFKAAALPALVDVDRVVRDYCARRRIAPPDSPEEKIALHLRTIEERIDALSAALQTDRAAGPDCEENLMEMAAFAGALGAAVEVDITLAFIDEAFGRRTADASRA